MTVGFNASDATLTVSPVDFNYTRLAILKTGSNEVDFSVGIEVRSPAVSGTVAHPWTVTSAKLEYVLIQVMISCFQSLLLHFQVMMIVFSFPSLSLTEIITLSQQRTLSSVYWKNLLQLLSILEEMDSLNVLH